MPRELKRTAKAEADRRYNAKRKEKKQEKEDANAAYVTNLEKLVQEKNAVIEGRDRTIAELRKTIYNWKETCGILSKSLNEHAKTITRKNRGLIAVISINVSVLVIQAVSYFTHR